MSAQGTDGARPVTRIVTIVSSVGVRSGRDVQMATVTTWTGLEANALRHALRMSVTDFAAHLGAARRTVVKWGSRGVGIRPCHEMQLALDTVLVRASDDVRERFEDMCVKGTLGAPEIPDDCATVFGPRSGAGICGVVDEDGVVRRRDVFSALAAVTAVRAMAGLLDALVAPDRTVRTAPAQQLVAGAATAKTDYQACRYSKVLDGLRVLIPSVESARSHADEDDRAVLDVAATDLYHVLGSVLLKLGDRAMALIAAERSTRYGLASHDPVAAGTSARIMTHALMSNGHAERAVRLARTAAGCVERDTRLKSADAVAVFGALLLRGAIAATRADDRLVAEEMLTESSRAAARLGHDGNDRWTGFGPTNVLLHRVNVALCFGDAGTAIELARRVPLGRINLAERKASLFVDVAQAYSQWGRHEQSLRALQTACRIAPEEIRARPAVHRILGDLAVMSRGPIRMEVAAFAADNGIRL